MRRFAIVGEDGVIYTIENSRAEAFRFLTERFPTLIEWVDRNGTTRKREAYPVLDQPYYIKRV